MLLLFYIYLRFIRLSVLLHVADRVVRKEKQIADHFKLVP